MSKPTTLLELFDSPSKWTKGEFARNAEGEEVSEHDSSATCWCLLGGLGLLYEGRPDKYFDMMYKVVKALQAKGIGIGGGRRNPIASFNDDPYTTFDDVIDVVRKAGV